MRLLNRLCFGLFYLMSTLPPTGCRDEPRASETTPGVALEFPANKTCLRCARVEKSAKEVEASEVHPNWVWSEVEFYKFCHRVTPEGMTSLRTALRMKEASPAMTRDANIREIQKEVLWISSNIVAYPFKNEEKVNYHELCRWVARQIEVDRWVIDTQPTLLLERAICEKLWIDIWDKLTLEQRQALIGKLDPEKRLDSASVATMSGTGALAALAGAVYVTGFAFYTTLSVTICTVAGWFGVTLSFSAYVGSSTIVAFLSGPVGWALIAIGAVASTALLGKADAQRTAAFIVQVHLLKVSALQQIDATIPDLPKRSW